MSRVKKYTRNKLFLSVAAAAAISASPLSWAESEKYTLDIKAQSATDALLELSRKTGTQIVLAYGVGNNVRLPAVNGEYTLEVALNTLLSGTGLEYQYTADDVVEIRAADAPQGGEADDKEPDEEVVITGTRLKGYKPAAQVISIDREKIEKGGYTSLEDVFRRLPQNVSSLTGASVESSQFERNPGAFPANQLSGLGQVGLNLRGLGSASTLVLVNGRRRATSATGGGSFTDISSIPLSQVERVEILNDGASAIYGADAVAGVVNIILRKDYEALTTQLRHENSSSGADMTRFNLGYTFSWDSGSLTTSIDLSESDSPDTNKFIRTAGPTGQGDFTDLGGQNIRFLDNGTPGVFFEVQGESFFGNPQVDFDAPLDQTGAPITGDRPSRLQRTNLGPSVENTSLRLNLDQELNNSLSVYADVSFTRQEDGRIFNPTSVSFGPGAEALPGLVTPAGARSATLIPVDNVHIPSAFDLSFGAGLVAGYSFENELQQISFSEQRQVDTRQATLGLQGELPFVNGWTFDLSYSDNKEEAEGFNTNFASAGGSTPRQMELTALVENALRNLNVFTDGTDQAVLNSNTDLLRSLITNGTNNFDSDLKVFQGSAQGTLFSLPAGDVSMAVGFEYREDTRSRLSVPDDLDADITVATGDERESDAYFVEIGAPLLKDLPLIQEMTLTLAARHESFEQQGLVGARNRAFRQEFFPFANIPTDLSDFDALELIGFDEFPEFSFAAPLITQPSPFMSLTISALKCR